MKAKKFQARQGDIFFEAIDSIPTGLKKKTDPIIAEGEVSGHVHQIDKTCFDNCDLFVDTDGNIFARSAEPIVISHDEHGTVTLPPGEYNISRQREYDPIAEERQRQVAD